MNTTFIQKITTVSAIGLFIFFFRNLSSQVHCDGLDSTQEALEKLEPSNMSEKTPDENSRVPYLKYAVFFIVGVTIVLLVYRSYFSPGGGAGGGGA